MDLNNLEKKVNIIFKNKDLLKQAFIHRSYINENFKTGLNHNERLEFLGDAVLELVTTDFLYKKYPNHNEGDLTAYRSALVNTINLSEVAKELFFNDFLMLSKGEAKDMSRARSSILADAYEAFVGAVYLDQGYNKAAEFIANTALIKIDEINKIGQNIWLYRYALTLVNDKGIWDNVDYLESAIYSILDQSYNDFDLYIVKDGPISNKAEKLILYLQFDSIYNTFILPVFNNVT